MSRELWLPGGGRFRSARARTAQGAGRGNDPRFRDRWRIAAAAGFGNVWAIAEQTEYTFPQGEHAHFIPGSDDVLVLGSGGGDDEGLHRIAPDGAGTPIWICVPVSTLIGGALSRQGVVANDTYAWFSYRHGPASGSYSCSRCGLVDGVEDWRVAQSNLLHGPIGLHVASGNIWGGGSTSTNGMHRFDGLAASLPSAVLYTAPPTDESGSVRSRVITADGLWMATLTSNEELQFREMAGDPGSGSWAADTTVEMDVDPSVPWGTISGDCKIVACPVDQSAVWVTTADNVNVFKFDAAGNELAHFNIETDIEAAVPGVGVSSMTAAVATDIDGYLYLGFTGAYPAAGTTGHVAKYSPAGELITSTMHQGLEYSTTLGTILDLTVTPVSGHIWVTQANGYVTRITQAR